mgnify:CR=1 FL=1
MKKKRVFSALLNFFVLTLLLTLTPAAVITAQDGGGSPATRGMSDNTQDLSMPLAGSSGGIGYYSSTAFGFMPKEDSVPYSFSNSMLCNPDTNLHQYMMPIYLPQGAANLKFTAWLVDNDPDQDMDILVQFYERNQVGNYYSPLTDVNTTGNPGSVILSAIASVHRVINLENSYYYVTAFISPGCKTGIVSFRIDYTY